MAASQKTVQKVVSILCEELDSQKVERLIHRLIKETEGNSSFKQTLKAVLKEYNKV